ncbi:class I adenylate-forming enzyme family protein [Gordonia sp. CPCC 205515]|uniref:class I adenylate-forming enzyme family protein n=1 Tax=Gordonia sp. CPCC 205515 TaxID=3140791 RepID=UPI003AF3AEF1
MSRHPNPRTGVLAEAILDACTTYRDRPAIGTPHRAPVTYGDVGGRIEGTAEALRDNGFGPGHRMLFSIRPAPDSMIFLAAALAAGGSIVFADPGMSRALFDARVRVVAPTHAAVESLIYSAGARGPIGALARRRGLTLPRLADLDVVHIRSGPWLPGVPRAASSTRRLRRRPAPIPRMASIPDEALIVFTSGTTAQPRGVVHTHDSLLAGFRSATAALRIDPDAVVLTDQAMIGLPVLLSGARWILPRLGLATHAGPARMTRILGSDTEITHTFVVPGELPEVLDRLDGPPKGLSAIVCGGAPVTPGLARMVAQRLPDVDLYAIYGMTERVPIAVATGAEKLVWTGPGDPLGTVVDGVRTRLDDGELVISGHGLCAGYLSPVDGTLTAVDEIATGDLATEVDGRLALIGRTKDMIIRGTVNIYPALYEPAISAISGVRECAIVGIGGDDVGDPTVVLALVVDEPSAEDRVRRHLDDLIDRGSQPDRIVVVDEIPRAGRLRKPDRRALAAQLRG